MPDDQRDPLRQGARRRRLTGAVLLGGGGLLVALTALAATGIVPLWRPSVPPPPALVEARATRITLPPDAAPRAAAAPAPTTLADTAPPTPAPPPTPFSMVGAPPGEIPTARPPASPPVDRETDRFPEPLAAAPGPATPSPTFQLPTLPPSPTLITRALPTHTPRPTAVPPLPPPGLPVHLVIPRIHVDTKVVELSTALDAQGVPQWETVPFVAGHYRMTGLVGARTNVVLSGHVVTRDMGNVFRDLHLLRPGDPVVVYTDQGQFTYRVSELHLVDPADTSVLAPSSTPQLSLITCAGAFDFRTHTFSQRLVVVGDLVTA
jgi:LPXTG-site transpeptidase (sortase) family protein